MSDVEPADFCTRCNSGRGYNYKCPDHAEEVRSTMSKPTLTVVALDTLTPSPINARKRNAKARTALDGSLETFGAARSIVVDGDGVVRAGDGTLDAARAAGITEALIIETEGDRLVVVKRKDWSVREAIAYALADNETGVLSTWDADVLGKTLADLDDFDFGSDLFDGFVEKPIDGDDFELKEWDADDLEMTAVFEFSAPIELQAEIRAMLEEKFPKVIFEESVLVG